MLLMELLEIVVRHLKWVISNPEHGKHILSLYLLLSLPYVNVKNRKISYEETLCTGSQVVVRVNLAIVCVHIISSQITYCDN